MIMLTRLIFVYWGFLGMCSLTPKRPSAHSSYSSKKKKRMKNNCGMPIRSSQYENSNTCDVMWALDLVKYVYPCKFQWFSRE
ncbi:hypothetical protein ACB094_03G100700 [Castanea mollissima]